MHLISHHTQSLQTIVLHFTYYLIIKRYVVENIRKQESRDVPGGPVVKNLPCNVGDM